MLLTSYRVDDVAWDRAHRRRAIRTAGSRLRRDRRPDPPPEPFVVHHRIVDEEPGSGHTQVWIGDRLRSWADGLHGSPDITLRRDRAADLADLGAGDDPTAVIESTTIVAGHRVVDLLGTDGTIPKEMDGWRLPGSPAVRLTIPDTPLGPAVVVLRWDDGGLAVDWFSDASTRLVIELPYADAMAWIWDDLILGNLFDRGLRFKAEDVYVLSEVEGVVSAPHLVEPDRPAIRALLDHRAVRRSDDATIVRQAIADSCRPEG